MNNINFAQTIIKSSQNYPNKLAYRDGTDLTYGELSVRIRQVAKGLVKQGLKPGDHIVLIMEDCVDWPAVFLACVYIGVVPLTLSTVVSNELFWQISQFADCKLVISGKNNVVKDNALMPIIDRKDVQNFYTTESTDIAPVMRHPDSPVYMGISSGSTGMPKVAVHRHQVFYEMIRIGPLSFGMTGDDTILSIAKMSWGYGLQNSLTYTLGLGATAIVIPELPSSNVVFDYINRYTPSIVVTSPGIIRRMLATAEDKYLLPSGIKHFHSSSEHTPAAIYDRFLARFGIQLRSSIGMMETCQNYAADYEGMEHDRGTVGKVLPNCQVKLLDADGDLVQEGQVGEIYVNTPAAAMYYYKNYEKTKQTFVGNWVRTGDCGYWNEKGNLVFSGRTDDIFKVNDLIVSPVAIEAEIVADPTVDQAVVTGVKNLNDVTEVHAFIVPKDSFDLSTFNLALSKKLFPHQMPKRVHLVDAIPETMTNKKDRKNAVNLIS